MELSNILTNLQLFNNLNEVELDEVKIISQI